jgi:hypothetical protein
MGLTAICRCFGDTCTLPDCTPNFATEPCRGTLLAVKAEVAEPFGAVLPVEAVELLALYLECTTDAGIPAKHGAKDVIKVGPVQKSGTAIRRMTIG